MKKIACYGDSNTFGYQPQGGGRYNKKIRWPGRLKKMLGDAYQVKEEGLCGRTTAFDDFIEPGRNGLDGIEKAMSGEPAVDLLILMLGSNDCKSYLKLSVQEITQGLMQVLRKARACAGGEFQTLIIAPAAMTPVIARSSFGSEFDLHSVEMSKELAGEYEALAKREGAEFLDGSLVTKVGETDGLHLEEEGHRMLAEAVYQKIRKMEEI